MPSEAEQFRGLMKGVPRGGLPAISLKKRWLLLWSLAAGCLGALGVLLVARLFGAPNGHIALIANFPAAVAGLLLLHAGPWIAGRVHRSWWVAAIIATTQPLIAGLLATCWLLSGHRTHGLFIALLEFGYLTLSIGAGILLVNVLPLGIGRLCRSWKVALIVAFLQPFALLVLAVILLITRGFASPR